MKLVLRWRPLALIFLGFLGFALRIYGLNWDQGNSFHPDERQILFHVTVLSWPTNVAQFLDPVKSPLNPHFFAYGSLPMYLLALVGGVVVHFFPTLNTFAGLILVGRVISALAAARRGSARAARTPEARTAIRVRPAIRAPTPRLA